MISAIIVWGSLLAGVAFSVAYLLNPRLRAQVEQPKFEFQRQVQNYDNNVPKQESKGGQQ